MNTIRLPNPTVYDASQRKPTDVWLQPLWIGDTHIAYLDVEGRVVVKFPIVPIKRDQQRVMQAISDAKSIIDTHINAASALDMHVLPHWKYWYCIEQEYKSNIEPISHTYTHNQKYRMLLKEWVIMQQKTWLSLDPLWVEWNAQWLSKAAKKRWMPWITTYLATKCVPMWCRNNKNIRSALYSALASCDNVIAHNVYHDPTSWNLYLIDIEPRFQHSQEFAMRTTAYASRLFNQILYAEKINTTL